MAAAHPSQTVHAAKRLFVEAAAPDQGRRRFAHPRRAARRLTRSSRPALMRVPCMKHLYDFSALPVDRTISPHDTMLADGLESQYYDIGHRALELVNR